MLGDTTDRVVFYATEATDVILPVESGLLLETAGTWKEDVSFSPAPAELESHLLGGGDALDARDTGPFYTGKLIVHGGDGNDGIHTNTANDEAYGGPGNDTIEGQAGNDLVDGGEGDDTLRAHVGDDVMTGGPGADSFTGDTCRFIAEAGADVHVRAHFANDPPTPRRRSQRKRSRRRRSASSGRARPTTSESAAT